MQRSAGTHLAKDERIRSVYGALDTSTWQIALKRVYDWGALMCAPLGQLTRLVATGAARST
jgi:hypothetical protein